MTSVWVRLPAVTSVKVDLISRNWAMFPVSRAVEIEALAISAGVARLQRVEDGAWDPEQQK